MEIFRSNAGEMSVWNALRFMYGITPKLTLIGTASASNHHTKKFPFAYSNNFVYHHHPVSYQNSSVSNKPNPFLMEGFSVYAKYRIISKDADHSHLRCALYGEFSGSFVAHREAEPLLMGGTPGAGAGLIITKLSKKLALSATAGYIHPFKYKEPDSLLTFRAGNALVYTASLGYLLFPAKYKSYKDLNINLYVECMNKIFGNASYAHHGLIVNTDFYPVLMAGQYSEVRPAIQCIINSNTRIDLSVSLPVYQRIALRAYPVYMLNIQRYFYGS